jgi:hypothetical protein
MSMSLRCSTAASGRDPVDCAPSIQASAPSSAASVPAPHRARLPLSGANGLEFAGGRLSTIACGQFLLGIWGGCRWSVARLARHRLASIAV